MVEGTHVLMPWKEISNQVRIFAQNSIYVEFHLFKLFPSFLVCISLSPLQIECLCLMECESSVFLLVGFDLDCEQHST